MDIFYTILIFIVSTVFHIVLYVLMIRMLLQLFKADANNAVAGFVATYTNPLILPLREYIPRTRHIDLSTILLWLIVDVIKYTLMVYIGSKQTLMFAHYLMIIPADFFMQATSIILICTVFHSIINFVAPGLKNAATDFFTIIATPAMRLSDKFISSSAGFNFAPFLVIGAIICCKFAITQFIPANYFFL